MFGSFNKKPLLKNKKRLAYTDRSPLIFQNTFLQELAPYRQGLVVEVSQGLSLHLSG
jgi:hypothetical protein